MANHITQNSTIAETNSMMPERRSATNVIPIGASHPASCTVWMPSMSATRIIDAAMTASTRNVKNAMLRCSTRCFPAKRISAAASAGMSTGSGMMYGMYGISQST